MISRRSPIVSAAVMVVIGSLGLASLASNGVLQAIRTADLIKLLGCGACFGVAAAIFGYIMERLRAAEAALGPAVPPQP